MLNITVRLLILLRRTWPDRPVRRRRTMLFALVRRHRTHWQISNGVNKIRALLYLKEWDADDEGKDPINN